MGTGAAFLADPRRGLGGCRQMVKAAGSLSIRGTDSEWLAYEGEMAAPIVQRAHQMIFEGFLPF